MKAVRIHEYGGPDQLKFEDGVPEPTMQGGTVLIALAATSVNPIDWKVRSGARQKDFPLKLPAILGRDVSGTVRAVGASVTNFKPGDRVIALSTATYAELVAVESSVVTHLPDGVNLEDAAALPLIALTGDQLVRHAAAVQSGQTIVVTGALGSVGRAAVHSAKKLGARVIAGVRTRQLDDARLLLRPDVVELRADVEQRFEMRRVGSLAAGLAHVVGVVQADPKDCPGHWHWRQQADFRQSPRCALHGHRLGV